MTSARNIFFRLKKADTQRSKNVLRHVFRLNMPIINIVCFDMSRAISKTQIIKVKINRPRKSIRQSRQYTRYDAIKFGSIFQIHWRSSLAGLGKRV
ncbi:hypothetical protein B0D71_01100 [Pseudomonas laurylsulfativorans]|uniref:Uncharacterized protein n=1 Tax=Pseudomonas laurylsulfativorans TaxID=1943631 RepID=A0A2S3VU52_9PSED|nr:hypothetical protein B0D71_01100 [Pseudomonas laurylsulfativorans]